MSRRLLTLGALSAAAFVASVVLSGCSGDSDDADDATSATTNADGTTVAGTTLQVGQPAVVNFAAGKKHTSKVRLTVTKVEQGRVKDFERFKLNDSARRSTIYYVSTRVKNLGPDALSGKTVTLYGKVSDTTVVPPVVLESTFPACDYQPLPPKFEKDDSTRVCMVFMAPRHGTMSEVQWRPAGSSEPISWTPVQR
ncbi:MAG TPA: hypothetical protein VH419_05915 [Nocardioidaceae bacterium]|jgi:hypothetical protein